MIEMLTDLSCPHCDGELIELDCEIPSGHTHQCEGCGALYSPYGGD